MEIHESYFPGPGLWIVKKGRVKLMHQQISLQIMEAGDFWGEESVLNRPDHFAIEMEHDASAYMINDMELLRSIPILRWKLIERLDYRKGLFQGA